MIKLLTNAKLYLTQTKYSLCLRCLRYHHPKLNSQRERQRKLKQKKSNQSLRRKKKTLIKSLSKCLLWVDSSQWWCILTILIHHTHSCLTNRLSSTITWCSSINKTSKLLRKVKSNLNKNLTRRKVVNKVSRTNNNSINNLSIKWCSMLKWDPNICNTTNRCMDLLLLLNQSMPKIKPISSLKQIHTSTV